MILEPGKIVTFRYRGAEFKGSVLESEENGVFICITSIRENEEGVALIPSEVANLPVTGIKSAKTEMCYVKELVIPASVTSLSMDNDYFPDLEEIRFGEGSPYSTDGRLVFSADGSVLHHCFLPRRTKTLRIPRSVKRVADEALDDLHITELIVENPQTEFGKFNCFSSPFFRERIIFVVGNRLVRLLHPSEDLVIPSHITQIDSGALEENIFLTKNLTAPFLLPPSLTKDLMVNRMIRDKLETFELNSPDYDIPLDVLRTYEHLSAIRVTPEHPRYEAVDGVLYDKKKKRLLFYPREKPDTSFTPKEGTLSIAPHAFQSCQYLKELSLPPSVREIGSEAITSCPKLESLWLSDQIAVLPDRNTSSKGIGTLSNHWNLTSVHLPEKLLYLGSDCLFNTGIREIVLPEGLRYLSSYCLATRELTEVSLPRSCMAVLTGALNYCTRIAAYEGTAKGLVTGVNTPFDTEGGEFGWSSAWVSILGEDGKQKGLFFIPQSIGSSGQEALAQAWDAPLFDYDRYVEAFDDTRSMDERITMAVLLVLDGGKTQECGPFLKKNSKRAAQLLIGLGDTSLFSRFLDLGLVSKVSISPLLEACNDAGKGELAAYLLAYQDKTSSKKKKSSSRFAL